MHRVSLLLVTCALAITRIAAAQHEWTGAWQTNWRDGGARMVLKQQGNTVTGTYPLFGGRIEGKVMGSELEGTWFEGDRSGPFEFFMGRDKKTFTGRDRMRGWWTGQRTDVAEVSQALDLENPRTAFASFVVAANVARMGNNEAWGLASQAVEFDPVGEAAEILGYEGVWHETRLVAEAWNDRLAIGRSGPVVATGGASRRPLAGHFRAAAGSGSRRSHASSHTGSPG
ncbi:MAG: hypothetical protein EBU31_18840 [Proteobacteria bacterium]|nr:hypothetical protein [Pseudomonadota bacterium]